MKDTIAKKEVKVTLVERDNNIISLTRNNKTISLDRYSLNIKQTARKQDPYRVIGLDGQLYISKEDTDFIVPIFDNFKKEPLENRVVTKSSIDILKDQELEVINTAILSLRSTISALKGITTTRESSIVVTNIQQAILWSKENKEVNYK